MGKKVENQLYPPGRKKGQEVELNKMCTIIKKNGTTTTVVGYGPQKACEMFIDSCRDNAKSLDIKLVSKYSILKYELKK